MNYFSYFSEIEETFVRRRGKNLLLSPLDWALIEAWKEREIPLHVVLRAIENIFDQADQQPARKRSIKSLVYCRDEVENLFAAWLAAQIGNQESPKSQVPSPKSNVQSSKSDNIEPEIRRETVISHLQFVAENLQSERAEFKGDWKMTTAEVLARLQRARELFETDGNLENLETVLSGFDRQIDEQLPLALSDEELSKIKAETVAQLRSHESRMKTEVYNQTFKNLLIKNLRDQTNLPRFSLFYL